MKTSFLLVLFAAFAWAQAPAADPVVLTIGTEKITRSAFEGIIASLNDQQRASLAGNPEAKRQLAESVAELKLMAQEARTRKLDQSSAVKAKVQLQTDQVLASAVYAEMMKIDPSDAQVQAFYKEHAADMTEAKGRHILIRFAGSRVPVREGKKDLTDAEALAHVKEIRAKLVAGAKFADVAKAESDDVGSGENGGDLGSFGPGQMVPEFDKAAFEIPVGTVSEPVKSEFGYHLILIESRGTKKLDEVREEIMQALKPDLGTKAIDALKAKSAIVYDDGYFGAAPLTPLKP